MLAETIAYRNVYIICGYTDMRKSINGLVAILIVIPSNKVKEQSIPVSAEPQQEVFRRPSGNCLRAGINKGYQVAPLPPY